MRKVFQILTTSLFCLGSFILDLIFNGHFHLSQVIYVDGQLVDISNADGFKASLSSGKAVVVW